MVYAGAGAVTMDKLQAIRELMNKQGIAAFVQPVHDEYMGEYPPSCNRRLQWLTGFSGSAGTVVITAQKAALFTDGRYTIQAKNETDAILFEQHNSGDVSPSSWLTKQLSAGDRVGYDPRLYTSGMVAAMQKTLGKQITLTTVDNLVDQLWQDRPAAPATSVVIQPLEYAGESSDSKCQRVAAIVANQGADLALITTPEAVCWLLNIRGRDVENTPVVLTFALIASDGTVQLFVTPERCDEKVKQHLGNKVQLLSPKDMQNTLAALGQAKKRVLADAGSTPIWFIQTLTDAGAMVVEGKDPCSLLKSLKNKVELQGFRHAHIRDGAALTKALHWIDTQTLKNNVSETDVCKQVYAFRAEHALFIEPSFDTISGSGAHGAIVHYRVSPETDRVLQQGELLLLDSGGQYPDGTTDVTRTMPIGVVTPEQKDRFTRVLKGHIALATACFPEGTSGSQLDALARQYLWQAGLDYDHGTGHGVGHCLSVHEGPQRIGKRGGDVALQAGMILSNEPGYYKDGEYGIRIENLVAVVEKPASEHGKKWFAFETITCVPIDTRLVDTTLLTADERQWLNAYHEWVYASLSDLLESPVREWLKQRCAAV